MGVGGFAVDVVEEPVESGVHGVSVGLVVDGVEHRFHRRPHGLRCHGHQVRCVVGAASLPGRAGQVRGYRLDQAFVGVGGDQAHPGEPGRDKIGEEAVPRRAGLGGRDPQAENFPAPIRVDAGRD